MGNDDTGRAMPQVLRVWLRYRSEKYSGRGERRRGAGGNKAGGVDAMPEAATGCRASD